MKMVRKKEISFSKILLLTKKTQFMISHLLFERKKPSNFNTWHNDYCIEKCKNERKKATICWTSIKSAFINALIVHESDDQNDNL